MEPVVKNQPLGYHLTTLLLWNCELLVLFSVVIKIQPIFQSALVILKDLKPAGWHRWIKYYILYGLKSKQLVFLDSSPHPLFNMPFFIEILRIGLTPYHRLGGFIFRDIKISTSYIIIVQNLASGYYWWISINDATSYKHAKMNRLMNEKANNSSALTKKRLGLWTLKTWIGG